MNRKVLISVLLIGLVASAVSLGTFAVFTDTETSPDNTFTAGTLTIGLGTTTWSTGFNNMKPGDAVNLTVPVTNTGSLPLNYTVTTALAGGLAAGDHPVTVTGVTPASGVLAAGASTSVAVTITMPSAAGNAYQGASGTLAVTVNAVQQ